MSYLNTPIGSLVKRGKGCFFIFQYIQNMLTSLQQTCIS
jgi:hypothetical protein